MILVQFFPKSPNGNANLGPRAQRAGCTSKWKKVLWRRHLPDYCAEFDGPTCARIPRVRFWKSVLTSLIDTIQKSVNHGEHNANQTFPAD